MREGRVEFRVNLFLGEKIRVFKTLGERKLFCLCEREGIERNRVFRVGALALQLGLIFLNSGNFPFLCSFYETLEFVKFWCNSNGIRVCFGAFC